MFHFLETVTNTGGDSLRNWQIEVVLLSDGETVVPIFADENGTAISTVSDITNRAKSDASGNYDFFVPNGTYSLRFYDDSGEFQRLQRYLPMYGAPDPIDIEVQTGTSYTLALGDAFSAVSLNNASAITLTVPPDTDVGFDVGTFVEFWQIGAGAVTVAAGAGVTINSRGSRLTTSGQYAIGGLRKTAANTWILTGDLA